MTSEGLAYVRLRVSDEELVTVLQGYLDGAFLPCRLLPSLDPMFLRVVPTRNNAKPQPIELQIPAGSVLCIASGQEERLLGFAAEASRDRSPTASGAGHQADSDRS